jgi:hypothetical protein
VLRELFDGSRRVGEGGAGEKQHQKGAKHGRIIGAV